MLQQCGRLACVKATNRRARRRCPQIATVHPLLYVFATTEVEVGAIWSVWERIMPDPLSAAKRYRSNAAKFSELSRDAANPFIRDYYKGLAQRYLLHADNQEKIAWISEGPGVQAAPGAVSPEEAPSFDRSASPPPFEPAQEPARVSRRKRRRHSTP
jgi:hypothetical protein